MGAIGGEDTRVDLATQRVEFYGSTEARMSSLLQVIANKTNLQGTLKKGAESRSRSSTPGSSLPSPCVFIMQLDSETDIVLDGERYEPPCSGAAWNYSHEEPAYTSNSTRDGSEGLRNLGVIQTGLVDIKPPNLQQSDGGESRQLGSRETRFHAALEATMPDMYAPPGTQILAGEPPLKRKRGDSECSGGEWTVHKAHWRLRVQALGWVYTAAVKERAQAISGLRLEQVLQMPAASQPARDAVPAASPQRALTAVVTGPLRNGIAVIIPVVQYMMTPSGQSATPD
ncbi:hypothetical protein CIHG_00018 [Coccidioides immitis H538.4]|uniref:Uncharacterized protein n=1 Tax=Coccidioides immitis H538.4 TaxID=396776 RepID=A0A0J8RBG8_COCIT|nr:hypothetical protein CIHG_00018 [Coccidioides immitis H538.4]